MSRKLKVLLDIPRPPGLRVLLVLVALALLLPCFRPAHASDDLISPNVNFTLSEQETQLIRSLAPLRVMIDDNFVPLSFYDAKTGSFNGLSVELFRHVADKIGLKYQLLHDAELSWSDKVELFKKRKIDLLMPASFTEERARYGVFGNSFYETYYGTIVRKSSNIRIKSTPDLALYKVGVTKSSAIIPFMQSSVPGAQITYYENQKDLYQAVRNGEIDVALQNKNVFHDDRFNLGFVDLIMPHTIVEYPRRYAYYWNRAEPYHQLSAIIDRYLLGADYSRLISKYERSEDELILLFNEQRHQRKLLAFGIAGAMILLALLGLAYLNHRRFSAKLSRSLELSQHQQAKLRKSEERYRGLFDNSRDALMILEPPSWKYTSVNQASVNTFWAGDESEFIARGPWEFSPEMQPDGRFSIEKAREMMETALRDGYHFFEWTHRRIGGEEFPADVLLTLVEEGEKAVLQATVRDITDRKLAERALQDNRKQLTDIIEFLPDATLAIDKEKRIIIWNRAIERMTGVPASEMLGKGDYAYTIPFYGEARPQLMDMVFESREEIAARYLNITRDGDAIMAEVFCNALYNNRGAWLLLKASPLRDQSGTIIGAIESIRDITESKKAEEERKVLEQQFYHAQKLESLGVLAGGIAHDFNNILTVIMGHCYLAKGDLESEQEYKTAFQQVEIAGNRAADLCRQMLTYAGKSPMVQTRINLLQLVDEVVKMLQSAMSKNVIIELDLDQRVPDIMGDSGQIQQVVMNLVINAAEAIGDANGTVRVVLTKTVLEEETAAADTFGTVIPAGSYVCLEVADTGIGMDKETQKRIFEPFYTTKFTGRGLGMSAIRGIVASHGSLLHLSSAPGIGTTFKICFPVTELSDFAETASSESAQPAKEGGTIMLVDDEQTLRNMGEGLLEAMGFSALTAQHGREALEIYHERGGEIDLIFLDLIMPVMGGIETYHELRKLSPSLPIIFCSGYSVESVSEVIANDKNTGFVHKPYKPDHLRDVMMRVME